VKGGENSVGGGIGRVLAGRLRGVAAPGGKDKIGRVGQ